MLQNLDPNGVVSGVCAGCSSGQLQALKNQACEAVVWGRPQGTTSFLQFLVEK